RISMITAVHSAESSRRVAGTPVVKPPRVRIAPSSKRVAELRRQGVLVTHDGVTLGKPAEPGWGGVDRAGLALGYEFGHASPARRGFLEAGAGEAAGHEQPG